MNLVLDYRTGMTPGKPGNLLKRPPYQGPPGAKPPPEGYTYWTQRAELQGTTGTVDSYGYEQRLWKVTVYYTKADDPLAPLLPVTTEYLPSRFDLSKNRVQSFIFDRESPGSMGPGSVAIDRVNRVLVEDIDPEKAASVDKENQARAQAREARREKQRKLEQEAQRLEEMRQERIRQLEAQQRAEIEHAELIEQHRAQWRKEQEDIRKADAAHRVEIEEERKRFREELQADREAALQAERQAKEAARAKEQERAAQLEQEKREFAKGMTSLKEDDLEEVASGYRDVAKGYVKNATEPEHVVDALNLLGETMTYSSSDEAQEIMESAAPKQAEFVEETITKILTRPDDASLEVRKQDLKELGDRLDTYLRLPGRDPVYEERAKTRFYRQVREIRELEAQKAAQALQGQSEIDEKSQGLGNTGVPPQSPRSGNRRRRPPAAAERKLPLPPAVPPPEDLDQGHPPPM